MMIWRTYITHCNNTLGGQTSIFFEKKDFMDSEIPKMIIIIIIISHKNMTCFCGCWQDSLGLPRRPPNQPTNQPTMVCMFPLGRGTPWAHILTGLLPLPDHCTVQCWAGAGVGRREEARHPRDTLESAPGKQVSPAPQLNPHPIFQENYWLATDDFVYI